MLRDLNQAVKLSENLSAVYSDYINLGTKSEQMSLIDNLLYGWAKTDNKFGSYNVELVSAKEIAIGSANSNAIVNKFRLTPSQAAALRNQLAQGCTNEELLGELNGIKNKIQVVSAMTGRDFSKVYYQGDNNLKAFINSINSVYDELKQSTYQILLLQTRLKDYINLVRLDIDKDYNLTYNNSLVVAKFQEVVIENPKKAFEDLVEFINLYESKNDVLDGVALLGKFIQSIDDNEILRDYKNAFGEIFISNGDNSDNIVIGLNGETSNLNGGAGDDIIIARNADSKLYGGNNDDILVGNEGNDKLYGDDGNDTLIGGSGDDILEGGNGDDTYIFNIGDGADTITDYSGNDTIKFGEGITKEEITFKRISNDLVLKYGTDKSVKINSYYSSNSYKIEKVELDSGEFITSSQIDKIIEQINTYSDDKGLGNFAFNDLSNSQNLQLYGV